MMRKSIVFAMTALLAGLAMNACETAPKTEAEQDSLYQRAMARIDEYKKIDPGMQQFFDNSVGYAVFPDVGKAGFIFGGSYGRGVVFEQGRMIGYADITSGSFGAQAGAQGFSEIIFFQTAQTLEQFKSGNFSFSATASAVAIDAGASAATDFTNGVAVFQRSESGLMAEASVGGQGFSFEPLSN